MAYDKVVDSAALDATLVDIAEAIRGKTGKADPMTIDQMAAEIDGISTGGGGDATFEDGLVTRTLKHYENSRVAELAGYVFMGNTTIESVSFPNVTNISGSNTFNGCSALKTVNFPKLTGAAAGNVFLGCSSLSEVSLPAYRRDAGTPSFRGCASLRIVDFGGARLVGNLSFANCTALETVIFRDDMLTSLSNTNAFDNTPFAIGGSGGVVYVPDALIPEYQQATNWSTLYAAGTCQFVAIEGSEYE